MSELKEPAPGFLPKAEPDIDEYTGGPLSGNILDHFFTGGVEDWINAPVRITPLGGVRDTPTEPAPLVPEAPTPAPVDHHAKLAESFLQYLDAGWQASVTGLATRGKLPDTYISEDSPGWGQITAFASTLAGDLPAAAAGAVAGGAAGTAVRPGPGTVVGAGAGMMAVPAMVREALIDRYQNGDYSASKDISKRATKILLEGLKAGTVGATMAGSGLLAGGIVGNTAGKDVRHLIEAWAALSGGHAMSDILEGHLPKPGDFARNAAVIVMLGGAAGGVVSAASLMKNATGALQRIYAKTGVKPDQVLRDVKKEPKLVKEILDEKVDVPSVYKERIEPTDNSGLM